MSFVSAVFFALANLGQYECSFYEELVSGRDYMCLIFHFSAPFKIYDYEN